MGIYADVAAPCGWTRLAGSLQNEHLDRVGAPSHRSAQARAAQLRTADAIRRWKGVCAEGTQRAHAPGAGRAASAAGGAGCSGEQRTGLSVHKGGAWYGRCTRKMHGARLSKLRRDAGRGPCAMPPPFACNCKRDGPARARTSLRLHRVPAPVRLLQNTCTHTRRHAQTVAHAHAAQLAHKGVPAACFRPTQPSAAAAALQHRSHRTTNN